MRGTLGAVVEECDVGLETLPEFKFFIAKLLKADLIVLRDLMQEGQVKPVIDREYPMSETAEALGYLEEGHARGKVVITVE